MFRRVILFALFRLECHHVGTGPVFKCHKTAEVLVQNAAVAKKTVCVTFGAPCFGPNYRHICARSGYVTFCTISATAAREMTVCVMFGAPRAGFARASCRGQFIGHLSDGARGN